ncbi:MAG: hypothetical protein ACK50U_07470 [Acidobacteriota bacterium]
MALILQVSLRFADNLSAAMVVTRILAGLFTIAMLLGAQTDYRFAFPQSEILMGVDVKWLLKSPLVVDMLRNWNLRDQWGDLGVLTALFDSIDTVHLSAIAKSNSDSDLLLLVQGRFDSKQLMQMGVSSGLRAEQWGKIMVLVPSKKKVSPRLGRKVASEQVQFQMQKSQAKPSFALLDARRVLVGEEPILRVAIERLETGLTPQANPLFERARDLEAAHDLWAIGSAASLNQNLTGMSENNPLVKAISQARNFALGMALRRDLKLDLSMQANSAKAASEIVDLAKGALVLAKMSPIPDGQPKIDWDRAFDVNANGNLVKVMITMDQQDVTRLVKSMEPLPVKQPAEAKQQGIAKPEPEKAAAVDSKPAAPTRKTVLIYGLPGGPKEVPVN